MLSEAIQSMILSISSGDKNMSKSSFMILDICSALFLPCNSSKYPENEGSTEGA